MERRRHNLFLDSQLWQRLRVRAIEQGMSATKLLDVVLTEYLQKSNTTKGRYRLNRNSKSRSALVAGGRYKRSDK